MTNREFKKYYLGRSYIDIMRDFKPEITQEEASKHIESNEAIQEIIEE